jgi:putative MATE family efflux protein
VSRNIIKKSHEQVQKIATRSILLGLIIVLTVIVIGKSTIYPLFKTIGAGNHLLILINDYMSIWYLGVIFVVLPMIGNNIVRATGNTLLPGSLMVMSATINAVLDPLLIFGIGPFPEMGIQGAALATVIGRSSGFIFILIVLIKKYNFITLKLGKIKEIYYTWKKVLYIAGPASITLLITPVSLGIITKILSRYGEYAVAGFGVATKVESFALMVVNALGSVLVIFAGQNISRCKFDRIFKAIRYGAIFCLVWGSLMFLVSIIAGNAIAGIFSGSPAVISVTSRYLRIISFSYIFLGLLSVAVSVFNGINKPLPSAFFSSLRMIGIYVPLAWVSSVYFGLTGIFWSGFFANISVGLLSLYWLIKLLKNMQTTHFNSNS